MKRLATLITVCLIAAFAAQAMAAAAPATVGTRTTALRPDRLTRDRGTLREDFANYLRQHKQAALKNLSATIHGPVASPAALQHAVKAMGHLTGRKFHREGDPSGKAKEWLKRRGL